MRLIKQTRGRFATVILALFLLMAPTLAFGDDLAQLLDDGSIWRYIGPPCATATSCPGWILIDSGVGRPIQIAARPSNSELFQRHDDGSIWKWDGSSRCDAAGKVCPGWTRINNDARTKDILASGSTVFQRLADGSVWEWDEKSPCDAAGKVCPGWAPPLNMDSRTVAIVSLDPIRPPSPPGPK